MAEDRIWAPWRLSYIAGDALPRTPSEVDSWREGADRACFFCRAAAHYAHEQVAQKEGLVVEKGLNTIVLLNRYPYTNGHLLVAPLRHVAEFDRLSDEEHLGAMHALARMTELLRTLISAEGFNVGLNLGRVAGAGVPGHLHWHLVPRWTGDNNFMPTTAGARVISQSLEAMWEALTEAISQVRENGDS